jgi:hypothetical protein
MQSAPTLRIAEPIWLDLRDFSKVQSTNKYPIFDPVMPQVSTLIFSEPIPVSNLSKLVSALAQLPTDQVS